MHALVFAAFADELGEMKEAGALQGIGKFLVKHEDPIELAGLGVLAAPSVDELQAHTRAAVMGEHNREGVEKRLVMPHHVAAPLAEAGGLGMLAAPIAAKHMLPESIVKALAHG